jgi:hypothetical protein
MTTRMALATRVACNKESDGNSCKSDGNEDAGRVMATRAMATVMVTAKAMMWVMVMAMRLVGNEKGKGEGGKGDGDDDEGCGQRNGEGVKCYELGGKYLSYEEERGGDSMVFRF